MSTTEPDLPLPMPPDAVGMPGRVAAAIIGLQAVGCALAVVFALILPEEESLGTTSKLMFGLFTLMFALGLGLVSRGLWRGTGWPRTAAVVWLLLLLPVGWGLVQASQGLVGALVLGSAVLGIAAVATESKRVSEHGDPTEPLRDPTEHR